MTLVEFLVIGIAAVPLTLVLLDRLRPDIAALIIAAALGLAQFVGLPVLGAAHTPGDAVRAFSGLSQPVIVTLIGLFIVTHGLERTGVTRWLARQIVRIGGSSERRLIALLTTVAALVSLLMNNLAAGAMLLPSAINISNRTGIRPSRLLMPIAFGTLLGGAATYFTTANIVVSDLLVSSRPPQPPLSILDFTPTGGLIAIGGIIFITLFASSLLPDRAPSAEQMMVRHTGSELEDLYQLGERLWEARILPDSPLAGKTLAQSRIGKKLGLAVIAIWHGRQAIFVPSPGQVLNSDDILVVTGREERIEQLEAQGTKIGRENHERHISTRGVRFFEITPSPRSGAEGYSLKDLGFRRKHGLTAVALLREGRSYRTDVADFKLRLGDSILLVGSEEQLPLLRANPDFIVLETDTSDQPVYWRRAAFTVGITGLAIIASILGVPTSLAMLGCGIVMTLAGITRVQEFYRTMEWSAIFLIAGMYALSLAMVNTGLADTVGLAVVRISEPFGPLGLAAGAYLITVLLTQVIGGQVTALITGPIAISAAISSGVNPHAIAVATAIGCSASFFTPIAHPVNILMIGPANYRFGDFVRLGWGLSLVCFVLLLVGMKLFWGL